MAPSLSGPASAVPSLPASGDPIVPPLPLLPLVPTVVCPPVPCEVDPPSLPPCPLDPPMPLIAVSSINPSLEHPAAIPATQIIVATVPLARGTRYIGY